MKTLCRCYGFILCLLVTGIVVLSGCESTGHFNFLGYTTKPTFDESIRTVYVPIATNYSYRQGLEFDLTRYVIREIGAFNSPYRVVSSRQGADTELSMKIVNRRKNVIIQNQLGENRYAELTLMVEVVWRDLRPGRVGDILSNPKRFDPNEKPLPGEPLAKAPKEIPIQIQPTVGYAPELGGNTRTAEMQQVERAARQIVAMMEIWP